MVAAVGDVPGHARHLQPRAGAGRAGRGVRARDDLGSTPGRRSGRGRDRLGRRRRVVRPRGLPRPRRDDGPALSALRRAGGAARAWRGVRGRRPARPAGVAEARLGRSRSARRRSARAAAGGEGARVRRARQGEPASARTRGHTPGGAGLPCGRVPGHGRAVDLAVLPSDPAAAVRFGGAPRRPPDGAAAGAAVPPSGGRGAAARSGRSTRTGAGSVRPRSASGPRRASVSDLAATEIARAGLRWMASDEEILVRSSSPEPLTPGSRCRPQALATAAGEVRVLFRDHALSDLVGFTYQGLDRRGRGRRLPGPGARRGSAGGGARA